MKIASRARFIAPPSVEISLTCDETSMGVVKSRSCSRLALAVSWLSPLVIKCASTSEASTASATTDPEIASPCTSVWLASAINSSSGAATTARLPESSSADSSGVTMTR
ncbi:hypothetical protein D9M72_557440 [compost metagenome]